MKRIATGSITITDIKGWDGKPLNYANIEGNIDDIPQLAQLTSGKIKKTDTYSKAEINDLMTHMVRFDNQAFIIYKPDSVTNKVKFNIKTEGIDNVNMVIKWSKTDYEYEQWKIGDNELITERTYPDDKEVVISFSGNVGIELLGGTLVDVIQWGSSMSKFVYLEGFLKDFPLEKVTAQDLLNTSKGISMRSFLENAVNFNQYLNRWFPRHPGNLSRCFFNCTVFNQNVNNLNVKYVTSTAETFWGCSAFNSEMFRWKMKNNFTTKQMFEGCTVFNQDLSKWDVSNVTKMGSMFKNTALDSRDLSKWDVQKVASHEDFLISTGSNNKLPIFP